MARFKVNAVALGLRSTPYKFADTQTGEVREGVSHRLVCFDQDAVETTELIVREDDLHLFGSIKEGDHVSLVVDVRANGDKLRVTAIPPTAAAPAKSA